MTGPNVKRIRESLRLLKTRIINAIKEVFERSRHITQVLRGAQDKRIRTHDIFGVCLKGRKCGNIDTIDIIAAGTLKHGIAQTLRVV